MSRARETIEALAVGGAAVVERLRTAECAWEGPGRLRLRVAAGLETVIADAEKGGVDLIVLDLDLPETDGLSALRQLRERLPFVPVVAVTASGSEAVALLALRDGAQDCLSRGMLATSETFRRAIVYAIERHGVESELRRARDAADTRERTRTEFVAVVSHEIRSPASTVLGFAELLLEGPLAVEQRDSARRILRAARNLVNLSGDLLTLSSDMARVPTLDVAPVELDDLVVEVLESCERSAREKGVALVQEIAPGARTPRIADRRRLRQVLVNLVGNAVKFTPKGSVRLDIAPDRAAPGHVRFTITDTGIGIPSDRLDIIFDAFTQADPDIKSRYGGSGLGLAVSKRLVEVMGGQIRAESQVGVGSRFFFSLPLAEAAAPARVSAPAAPPEPAPVVEKTARILVAEDSTDTQALMRRLLAREGYRADVVGDGRAALEAFRARSYDLVLLDIQMPVMDGYEAAAAIRQLEDERGLRRVPIVALTAHAMQEQIRSCLSAGCNAHIAKPVDRERLRAILSDHLGSGAAKSRPSTADVSGASIAS